MFIIIMTVTYQIRHIAVVYVLLVAAQGSLIF